MIKDAAETTRDAVSMRTGFAGFMMASVTVVMPGGAVGSARKKLIAQLVERPSALEQIRLKKQATQSRKVYLNG